MKPHPRIRKTIKWGGSAVVLLVIVVWIVSEQRIVMFVVPPSYEVALEKGLLLIANQGYPVSGLGVTFQQYPPQARFRLTSITLERYAADEWYLWIGLWIPLILALTATAIAWRLDTLARRRARLNLCLKCDYDRSGLAKDAVCPECGSKGGPA